MEPERKEKGDSKDVCLSRGTVWRLLRWRKRGGTLKGWNGIKNWIRVRFTLRSTFPPECVVGEANGYTRVQGAEAGAGDTSGSCQHEGGRCADLAREGSW